MYISIYCLYILYFTFIGKLHFSVHTLPDILLLHLQRLVITSTGGGKIRTLVKFPLSRLDMQPFTTGRVLACWSVYVVVYVVL